MRRLLEKILRQPPATEEQVADCWAEAYAEAVEHPGKIARRRVPGYGSLECVVPPMIKIPGQRTPWPQH